MSDREIKFTFNFDKFITTTVLGVLAMLAVRCLIAFVALIVAPKGDAANLYVFAGLLMVAFSSLFADAVMAAIVAFVAGAKGWSRKTAIYICLPLGVLSTLLFGGVGL